MKQEDRPGRVISGLAQEAFEQAKGHRQEAWSRYIQLHYQVTGNFFVECSAEGFFAWKNGYAESKGQCLPNRRYGKDRKRLIHSHQSVTEQWSE
jgi:hypothetical protein